MFKKIKKVNTVSFGNRFSVSTFHAELNNGLRGTFYLRESPPFSIIIPKLSGDKFIMVRQDRFAANKTSLEFPMGHVQGKNPKQAAIQELKEETGYSAKKIKQIYSFHISPAWSTAVGSVFIAERLIPGKPNLEPYEEITVSIINEENLVEMIQKGQIFDGATILSYFIYKSFYKEK